MITIDNQRSKIQGYISLYVIEIKNSRLHLIACNRNERSALHALHIARHFMHHCTSFHVAFCIISYHNSYISLHTSHTSHTRHACRAIRSSRTACISCIAPYVASFYVSFHVILSWKFIAYSFIPFRNEERRNGSKWHTLQLSACQVRRSNQEDKNATWVRHFSNDKGSASSRRFISLVQFRPRVPFLTKTSSCISQNSYLRVVQAMLRDPKLLEES